MHRGEGTLQVYFTLRNVLQTVPALAPGRVLECPWGRQLEAPSVCSVATRGRESVEVAPACAASRARSAWRRQRWWADLTRRPGDGGPMDGGVEEVGCGHTRPA
jgi:hypothetical protein